MYLCKRRFPILPRAGGRSWVHVPSGRSAPGDRMRSFFANAWFSQLAQPSKSEMKQCPPPWVARPTEVTSCIPGRSSQLGKGDGGGGRQPSSLGRPGCWLAGWLAGCEPERGLPGKGRAEGAGVRGAGSPRGAGSRLPQQQGAAG